MGLIDKIKSYLQEDEINDKTDKKPTKEKKSSKEDKPNEKVRPRKKRRFSNEHADVEEEVRVSYGNVSSSDEREYVKEVCEELIDVTYRMEDIKREYKVITEYLTDIQRFEELPDNMSRDIIDTARRIEMLDNSRQTYLQSENLLSVDQYTRIETHKNEIVDTIKNLNEMEMRDCMLRNDMGHLEGEKDDLKFMRDEYTDSILRVRGIIIVVLVLFLLATAMIAIIAVTTNASVRVYSLIVGVVAVVSFAIAYIRYLDIKHEVKYTDAKIKRAVSLLNKVKVKFINNTNTLDYVYEKYGVNSSKQLEFLWAQYNQMVNDERKYMQANSDFRVCCDELVDKLKQIGMKDPLVWPKQTNALIDSREMVEIKHNLHTRRQKIREQLSIFEKNRINAKTVLRASIEENPGLEGYIKDILLSYNLEM